MLWVRKRLTKGFFFLFICIVSCSIYNQSINHAPCQPPAGGRERRGDEAADHRLRLLPNSAPNDGLLWCSGQRRQPSRPLPRLHLSDERQGERRNAVRRGAACWRSARADYCSDGLLHDRGVPLRNGRRCGVDRREGNAGGWADHKCDAGLGAAFLLSDGGAGMPRKRNAAHCTKEHCARRTGDD